MPKTLFCTFLPDRIESFYHFHFGVGLVEWTVCGKSGCSEQRVSVWGWVGVGLWGGGEEGGKVVGAQKTRAVILSKAIGCFNVMLCWMLK